MKAFAIFFLVALAHASPVVPSVDEVLPTSSPATVVVEDVHVEKNSQDASTLLSEPIDKATKLIVELDEHIRKYLPVDDEVVVVPTTGAPSYSGVNEVVEDVPAAERQEQLTQMISQINGLTEQIETTVADLVARRRYVTAAMLRSMLNYVRRVRVNLERLQNRLQTVVNVATVQAAPGSAGAAAVQPSGGISSGFLTTISDRVNRITEEIGSLVSRIRGSFSPVGPTGAPLPALSVTSAPGAAVVAVVAEV